MSSSPLRWGIISAAKISFDFCVALSTLPKEHHVVTHIAARSLDRAKEFASAFNISTHSDSYLKVITDDNVDVVYIGTLNNTHKELSILAMNHGKPVLCEKPADLNSRSLEEILKVSEEKKVFYMEAVWTRCFPLFEDLKSKLGSTKLLGEPINLFATFGIKDLVKVQRIKSKDQGGSVLLDIGIYLLTLADLLFEDDKLLELKASGFVNEESNIDEMIGITMKFEGYKMAQLLVDGVHALKNNATLLCSKGKVNIQAPFWCSTKYTQEIGDDVTECPFLLPQGVKKTNFHNSEGLRFEAEHVRQCLQQGLIQSPVVSHDTTRRIMGYMDEIRKQIGSTVAL